MESTYIGPHIYEKLIFDKEAKQFSGETITFLADGDGTIANPFTQQMNFNP